jgi:hypothetical protein
MTTSSEPYYRSAVAGSYLSGLLLRNPLRTYLKMRHWSPTEPFRCHTAKRWAPFIDLTDEGSKPPLGSSCPMLILNFSTAIASQVIQSLGNNDAGVANHDVGVGLH